MRRIGKIHYGAPANGIWLPVLRRQAQARQLHAAADLRRVRALQEAHGLLRDGNHAVTADGLDDQASASTTLVCEDELAVSWVLRDKAMLGSVRGKHLDNCVSRGLLHLADWNRWAWTERGAELAEPLSRTVRHG